MFGIASIFGIPLKMWAYGAAIAAILGALTIVHHQIYAAGYAAGIAAQAPKLKAAAEAHDVDQGLIKAYGDAIVATNAQAKANEDRAAAQQAQAAAAVKAAQSNAQDAVKALAAWTARYAAALRSPACAGVLAEKICPDLAGDL